MEAVTRKLRTVEVEVETGAELDDAVVEADAEAAVAAQEQTALADVKAWSAVVRPQAEITQA